MKLFFPYVLFLCFAGALFLSISMFKKEGAEYRENRHFSLLCLFSAIWSLGFWGVYIQEVPEHAYIFRGIGMIGVLFYLIFAQILVCQLSDTLKTYRGSIIAASVIGGIIWYFIIQKDQAIYQLTEIGMTYKFKPGFWNNAYLIFCIVVAINMLVSIVYMWIRARRKRFRVLAKKLLVVEGIVVFGMIFDTILPLLGKPAIPGSSIGQFVALLAMYQAVGFVNRSRITVGNMSSYVYSSLATPVLVYDYNYRLQILNDVAYDFIGILPQDVGNISISSLFEVEDDSIFHFAGKQRDIDTRCCHTKLPCNLSICKIYDDYADVIGYIITVTDLSERMEAIRELEYAIREAKNANEAKTVFLANMSHEIRTPMNAIIGFSELALKKDVSPELREYIDGIRLASRNLLAIINDILDITKIESGKMEIIPDSYYIADLLDDVSLIISQQSKQKGLEFVMKTDEDIPSKLYGDKVRLRGVLINILNNAVKYTKEGTIMFETKIIARSEERIKISFVVKDTGVGIRPEDQKKLFQSFERFDQQKHYGVEGSGLGLSIAKAYVNLMGGEIKVDSVYGKGSTFTINVEQKVLDNAPLQRQFTIDKGKDDGTESTQMIIHDTRVLLVDDNHINLMVAKGLLGSYGLEVDVESGGKAAVEACKKMHYDIVFMDQMMPEMDGIEAMLKIREIDSYYALGGKGKIVVLTADAIRGVREKLLKKGFDEYLGKPMNLKQLERILMYYIPEERIEIAKLVPGKEEADKQHGEMQAEREIASAEEDELQYLKENLSDMDIALGLENSGGKVSDYLSILKINYTYGSKNLEELEEFLSVKDYENYTIKVHSVKSTTKGIGAMKVSDMALKQEEAGREERYEFIDEHFSELKEEYLQVLQKLEMVLRHFDMLEEEKAEEKGNLNKELIVRILNNIKTHVDAFEFAQVFEILEDMKGYQLPEEYQELFSRLEVLMDDLAVDDIQKLLEDALTDN